MSRASFPPFLTTHGGGLRKGDLFVMAAKPGSGKCTLQGHVTGSMATVTGRTPRPFLGFQGLQFNLSDAQAEAVMQSDLAALEARIVAGIGKVMADEVNALLQGTPTTEPPRGILSNYEPEPDA